MLDYSISSLCHKSGSYRFYYLCTPDHLAYIGDAESGSGMHFSPARKDPWLNNHSNGSCWDGGPRSTCNPSSIATPIKCTRKYASKPQTVSDGCHPRLGRLLRPQDLPAENVVQRIFAWMAADRTTSATHKRLLTPVHPLLGDHLIDARHLLRLGDHNGANDDDPAFEASFFACYQARPATEGNLSAVTVLDLLQKRTVHFCSRYNTVTGASAPPRPPSHPPLAPSSLIALLSPIEAGQTVYRTPQTYVVVRAWPRANAIPNRSLVHFDAPALSQLRLYKLFHAIEEHFIPEVGHVFNEHLTARGFPPPSSR